MTSTLPSSYLNQMGLISTHAATAVLLRKAVVVYSCTLESMHPTDYSIMLNRLSRILASSVNTVMHSDGILDTSKPVEEFTINHTRSSRKLTVGVYRQGNEVDRTTKFEYTLQRGIGPDESGHDDFKQTMAYFEEYYQILKNTGKPFSNSDDLEYEVASWIEDYL